MEQICNALSRAARQLACGARAHHGDDAIEACDTGSAAPFSIRRADANPVRAADRNRGQMRAWGCTW
jgi:hypothetical protein